MKSPGFFEGVALALALSLAGGVLYGTLLLVLPAGSALRLLIAGLSFAYVVYLLNRNRERVGRLTTLVLWFAMAGSAWLGAPPLSLYALAHVGTIWLVRSLYFHAGLASALADLALNGLALAAAVWAMAHSGSLFLSLWCFFLVQALFVAIPNFVRSSGGDPPTNPNREDRFQHAHRAAEAALRRLSSMH
jgi:hypothetical protein